MATADGGVHTYYTSSGFAYRGNHPADQGEYEMRKINQRGKNEIAAFLLSYHKNGIFISRDTDVVNSYAAEVERSDHPIIELAKEQSRTQNLEFFRLPPECFSGGNYDL
jgi:hypothetical protein